MQATTTRPATNAKARRPVSTSAALSTSRRRWRSVRRALLSTAVALAALIGCWWIFILAIDTSPLIAMSPADVFRNVTSGPHAADIRSELLHGVAVTLFHALIGLATGIVFACVLATAMATSKLAASAIQPSAVALRAIPVVAFAPVLMLIFDRGLVVIAMIGGIVTMVPTLYHLIGGLRSVRSELVDVIHCSGGGKQQIFFKTQVPTAAPSLALSLRVAAPGALVGALLGEWLATGDGLGKAMVRGQASFDYTTVWAATAVVTLAGMALYAGAAIAEAMILDRWAPERRGHR